VPIPRRRYWPSPVTSAFKHARFSVMFYQLFDLVAVSVTQQSRIVATVFRMFSFSPNIRESFDRLLGGHQGVSGIVRHPSTGRARWPDRSPDPVVQKRFLLAKQFLPFALQRSPCGERRASALNLAHSNKKQYNGFT
jgi:hypothetical protein